MRKIIEGSVSLRSLHLNELFDLSDVEVAGSFNCSNNNLTSLVGSPHTVGGGFFCFNNNLTSLVGSPHTVSGNFNCSDNNLTSLVGSPHTVSGNFDCSGNNLTNIEDIPNTVGINFYIDKELIDKFPKEYIRSLCKIKGNVVYV